MVKRERLKRRTAAGKAGAAEGSVAARGRRRRRGLRPGPVARSFAAVARGWGSTASCWSACRISDYRT